MNVPPGGGGSWLSLQGLPLPCPMSGHPTPNFQGIQNRSLHLSYFLCFVLRPPHTPTSGVRQISKSQVPIY